MENPQKVNRTEPYHTMQWKSAIRVPGTQGQLCQDSANSDLYTSTSTLLSIQMFFYVVPHKVKPIKIVSNLASIISFYANTNTQKGAFITFI